MPSGVYKRTEFHNKITSDAIKKWQLENPDKNKSWKKGSIPWNKNKKLGKYTKERCENISKALTGKVGVNKGRKWSAEFKLKVKNAIVKKWKDPEYRKKLSGKNSHYYRGGSKFSKDYGGGFTKELRLIVRKRDKHKCQKCLEIETNRKMYFQTLEGSTKPIWLEKCGFKNLR